MAACKKFFDRLFGIHPFLDNKDTWFHFMCLTFTIMCFFMYIDHMGEEHELKYGAIVFLFLCLENLSLFWETGRNAWQEASRFETVINEICHVLFLLIIPLISVNMYYKSDLGCYYLGIVVVIPMLYLLPILRSKAGAGSLYIMILKLSVFFNLLVSIRTTFFGVCCAMTILVSWSMKTRPNRMLSFGFRFASSYLLYLTLVNVPIPICDLDCMDLVKDNTCSYFGSY